MTELQGPLYKWLLADRRSPTKQFLWPDDDALWTPNAKPILCESGWHGMEEKDVLAHLPGVGAVLYEVEARGEIVKGSDKFAAESMRFKYVVGEATEQKLRLFMCDVAEDVLPIYEAWAPSDDRCRRSIEAGRAYALDPTDEKKAAGAARAAGAAGAAGAAWAVGAVRAAGAAEAAETAWAAGAAGAAEAAEAARAAWAARAAGAAWATGAAWVAGVAGAAEAAWAAEAAGAAEEREAMAKYSNWLIVRIERGK